VYFHCPWRASLNAYATGDAFRIIEHNVPGLGFKFKSAGGADGDAGAAIGAPFLIECDVLAEGLNLHPGLNQEINAFIVLFLVAFQLQYQQSLFFRSD
jgi:hypothetical protein